MRHRKWSPPVLDRCDRAAGWLGRGRGDRGETKCGIWDTRRRRRGLNFANHGLPHSESARSVLPPLLGVFRLSLRRRCRPFFLAAQTQLLDQGLVTPGVVTPEIVE
jgi:hypothetical protein